MEESRTPAESLVWLDPARLSFHWHGTPGPIRLTIADDRSVLEVHACRAFPLSDPDRLVQLFAPGDDGVIGILEDPATLSRADRRALEECLRRDRILPEVVRILSTEERRHLVIWIVETDRGVTTFDMDKVYENVRRQPGGDVMLTDAMGNRYRVDPRALDPASREMLERYG